MQRIEESFRTAPGKDQVYGVDDPGTIECPKSDVGEASPSGSWRDRFGIGSEEDEAIRFGDEAVV